MENNLRKLRKARNISLRALEQMTGINRGQLSEIERGVRKPTYDQRLLLNDIFEDKLRFWVRVAVLDD